MFDYLRNSPHEGQTESQSGFRATYSANQTAGKSKRAIGRTGYEICRLGEKAAELAPSQPWGDIRGMGNRLRHAYDRIDLDVLWNTIRERLPSLKADADS